MRIVPKNAIGLAAVAAIYLFFIGVSAPRISAQVPAPQNVNINTISGFVYNESREPIGQVFVELQNEVYSVVGRAQTRSTGMFRFSGLAPGNYYLRVITTSTDFEEQTKSVTLAAISGRSAYTEQVDFYLRARKSRNAAASAPPGVIFAQEVPSEARGLYESALGDLASKDHKAAFAKLIKALEIFPEYFLALDRLGNEYVLQGHYEAAYVLLTKALEVNKRSHSSTIGLGVALYRLNQIDLAIGHFRSAAELEPAAANGHLWLGIALHSKKKLNEALQSLVKANDLSNGSSPDVHFQLARVYKDMNRFDKSADELELFLKLSPDTKNAAEIRQTIATLRTKK